MDATAWLERGAMDWRLRPVEVKPRVTVDARRQPR